MAQGFDKVTPDFISTRFYNPIVRDERKFPKPQPSANVERKPDIVGLARGTVCWKGLNICPKVGDILCIHSGISPVWKRWIVMFSVGGYAFLYSIGKVVER